MKRVTYLILAGLFFASAVPSARSESIEWVRQLGTSSIDWSYGVSADGLGNVYISGYTAGSLGGPSAGFNDAFVSKYDAAGNFQWTQQLGTVTDDRSYGVSADSLGNVYISGLTGGSLGGPNAGGADAFVSKYDAAGTLQWSRQLGTSSTDVSFGVSADGLGNVYISGYTNGSLGGPFAGANDAFVSKYNAAGTFQWTRQLGNSSIDESSGVSADDLGNVYISGITSGSLGAPFAGGSWDVFVSKYDAAGNFQWTQQLGTVTDDVSNGVSADGLGNVYISGYTRGSLGGPNAGGPIPNDAFVSKCDAAGNLQWTRQLGTTSYDESYGVTADGLGNVYLSGYTHGGLGGPSAGSNDAFVSKYDASGNFQWTHQLGTNTEEVSYGVSADGLGNVYFSGSTSGSLGGPNAGSRDAFVVKIVDSVVPEPNTLLLLCFGSLAVLWRRRGLLCASILTAAVGEPSRTARMPPRCARSLSAANKPPARPAA